MKHPNNNIIENINTMFYKDEEAFNILYNQVFPNVTESVGCIEITRAFKIFDIAGGKEFHTAPTLESKYLQIEKLMPPNRKGSFTHILRNNLYTSEIYILLSEYFALQEILLISDESITLSNNSDKIIKADKSDMQWEFKCGNMREGDVNNWDDYFKYNNYGEDVLFMTAAGPKVIREVRHMTHTIKYNKIFKFKVLGVLTRNDYFYKIRPIIIWNLPR